MNGLSEITLYMSASALAKGRENPGLRNMKKSVDGSATNRYSGHFTAVAKALGTLFVIVPLAPAVLLAWGAFGLARIMHTRSAGPPMEGGIRTEPVQSMDAKRWLVEMESFDRF
jgi:hypothetical protein